MSVADVAAAIGRTDLQVRKEKEGKKAAPSCDPMKQEPMRVAGEGGGLECAGGCWRVEGAAGPSPGRGVA